MSGPVKPARAEPTGPAQRRLRKYAQLAAVMTLVVACYLVLHPLIPAVMLAAVVCSATWPLYVRLRTALGNRSSLAALAMTLMLIVLVVGPSVLLAVILSDNATALVESGRTLLNGGLVAPPAWVRETPVVGDVLADYWQRLATNRDSLATQWKGMLEPVRKILLGAARFVAEGLLQLTLAGFTAFFFYRDGEALMLDLRTALERLAGSHAGALLETFGNTATGVINGIFGTALAQALVALAGFAAAGVPGAYLLAAMTFFLSIVPVGPPLVWGGATAWLLYEGQIGWAIFMALWGFLAISSIDNLVKPYLISRSSNLPLLLVVLGVFGGVIAFGFIGLFIGPPVLAVGLALLQLWLARPTGVAAATR